jgi:hypothetical protein
VNTVVLTAHHKEDASLEVFKKYFEPMQVGFEISAHDLAIARDNQTEDNISRKNKSYCELTAYYCLWKRGGFDYAGVMHYRRAFTIKTKLTKDIATITRYTREYIKNCIKMKTLALSRELKLNVGTKQELEAHASALRDFLDQISTNQIDIILPTRASFAFLNVRQQFALHHYSEHLTTFNEIIISKHPEFQKPIETVNSGRHLHLYNMFIMKRAYFDEYHTFLFDTLFAMEQVTDLRSFNAYQQRMLAFLAERFLNYYIELKKQTQPKIKIKELQTIFIAENLE